MVSCIQTVRKGLKKMEKMNDIPLYKLLAKNGNIKLPSSIAIFNMGSATDCPSRKLGLCAACKIGIKCYALKAEQQYPKALPYRKKQEHFWLNITAEKFSESFLSINEKKNNKFVALRLNESGDFHSQDCVHKAEKIARTLNKRGIKVYVYTSRSDLNFENCKNLIILGSGFKKKGISNIFQIVKKNEVWPKNYDTCSGSCKSCSLCQNRGRKIGVLQH